MKVLLLTTCIYNEENYSDFLRLTNSLSLQHDNVVFEHGVLFQDFNLAIKLESDFSRNYTAKFFYIDHIMSLSKARNFLISKYLSLFTNYDYVSFPDDDCWYPSEFWGWFEKLAKRDNLDLFYTKFSSQPIQASSISEEHSTYKLVENASSNTTIYASNTISKLKMFDERFGVGSTNNGGEDTDFSVRAMLLSEKIVFINANLIGHRDPIAEFRYRYFKGSFGVLKIHCFKSLSLFLITIRKFMVGLVFFINKKIKISDFFINKS
ncbi:hypothetical protein ACRN9Z_18960 [Shewanella frigidimarina]|mgnify:CR=1 FL=1|uniref:hypothetical protein n=1 Tax=Shewanella TaxID=22 RepID=UPI0016036B63|nr:hypothetical protein [Shewanella sp. SG41-3]MBB1477096.1 hypothetical protein [Shewanella sp. SG41-3]|tara:strand:- start:1479 stop:2273 length:795 start_codon:yes stop_codon:yes gene_type:complete